MTNLCERDCSDCGGKCISFTFLEPWWVLCTRCSFRRDQSVRRLRKRKPVQMEIEGVAV